MRLVVIESPYAGATPEEIAANETYARRAMFDCLQRGEAPYASHLLYTQPGVLRDHDAGERKLGMAAGWHWMRRSDAVVVYQDHGISDGMAAGIGRAAGLGVPIEYRNIGV